MATIELNGASEATIAPIREALAAAAKARAIRAPDAETPAPEVELPTKATRANKILGFDSDGAPVAVNPEAVGGVPGVDGTDGTDGVDGASAYQVAVNNGFVGTESAWLLSLKGAKGDTGNAGAAGAKGDTGNTGAKGDKGDKGDTGDTGPTGPAGSGDMNGPASSTNKAIARFSGTGGKTLQNSAVTISDNGTINYVAAAAGYASFNIPHGTAPTTPTNGDVWTTSAGLYVRINGVTVGPLGAGSGGGGGGLTNITESIGSTGINSPVSVVALSASPSSSSADIALIPKNSGSIIASMPDGSPTGGNKRGTYAVDFQTSRNNASQVASGSYAVIIGGCYNEASGNYTIAGGYSSNASGNASIALGYQAIASSGYAVALGGYGNVASGTASGVLSGDTNIASGSLSAVLGGNNNIASGVNSIAVGFMGNTRSVKFAFAKGVTAERQAVSYRLCRSTTDATPTELTSDGTGLSVYNRIVLPNNYAYKYKGHVIARSSAGDVSAWDVSGVIKRGANAAATALVGTPLITNVAADSGASAWAVAISADTAGGLLKISVTGAAGTTIGWLAEIDTLEVGG